MNDTTSPADTPSTPPPIDKATAMEALREVIDPELDVNIVDLGLVYGVTIQGGQVDVRMTLTTPGCPLQTKLARWAKIVVLRLDGVEAVTVDVVWDPPWNPSMMSAAAKEQVGGGMCWGEDQVGSSS